MDVLGKPAITTEQFLDWEERQEAKYELDGFTPQLMVGETEDHADIQSNILGALNPRLRGTSCRIVGSDLKINAMGRIRYPDAFIVCSPRERGRTVVSDPVIVFEILSDSTQHADLVVKNNEYSETPSIRRYVILEQTHVGGIVFARTDTRAWKSTTLDGPDAVVDLPEIGVSLPLAEFYAGMALLETATHPGTRDGSPESVVPPPVA